MGRQTRRQLLRGMGIATAVSLAGCSGDGGGSGDGGDGNGSGGNGDSGGSGGSSPTETEDGGNGGSSGGQTTITTGTSVEGSTAFRIASTAAQYMRQENLSDSFALEATVTPGATGGFRMLTQGEVDMANPSTYSLDVAPDGGPFEEEPLQNFDSVRQVRGLYNVQPFIIVPQDSGIQSWEDLEGMTVSFGSAGAATRVPSETMVDLAIGLDNVSREYIGYSDQPSALRGGRVDAIFGYTNNTRIAPGWMQEMDATINWTTIPYTDDMMSQFESQLPYTSTLEIDGSEFFESYTDTLTVYNLTYVQSVMSEMSRDLVYDYAQVTHQNGEAMFEYDEALGFFPDTEKFLGGIHPDIPVHPGAYDYYVEEGVWEQYDLTAPPEA